jgi:hypothetical protein
MKGLCLLGGKFCFDVGPILIDFGMIVIRNSCLDFWWVTNEVANKWHAFGSDALRSRIVRRWEIARTTKAKGSLKTVKRIPPVAMPISIFTSEPTNEITVDKIESKKSAAKETGPRFINRLWLRRRGASGSKESHRSNSSMKPLVGVAKDGGVQALEVVAGRRLQKWPQR